MHSNSKPVVPPGQGEGEGEEVIRVQAALAEVYGMVAPNVFHTKQPSTVERVFWFGQHLDTGWKNPLGRVHSPKGACGSLLEKTGTLEALGFREIDVDEHSDVVPALTWLDRHSARSYEGDAGQGVLLRQLPHRWMNVLDDKRAMHLLLRGVGNAGGLRLPETYLGEEFLSLASAFHMVHDSRAWFIKHARGIKGKQVERHQSPDSARNWLAALPASSQELDYERHPNDKPALDNYVVQLEIPPLLLADQRRFCLRQHVLIVFPPFDPTQKKAPAPRGYSHRDVIVLPHSVPDDGSGENKAAFVQQVGKNHPTPSLLANSDGSRWEALRAVELQIAGMDADRVTSHLEEGARIVLERFCEHIHEERARQGGAPHGWYYNLFGFDQVLEAGSRYTNAPVLLEINVYPAIAGGTMGLVPRDVYARLVDDTLHILSPILDCPESAAGATPLRLGGFADLDLCVCGY
jgi:hypothetical protein